MDVATGVMVVALGSWPKGVAEGVDEFNNDDKSEVLGGGVAEGVDEFNNDDKSEVLGGGVAEVVEGKELEAREVEKPLNGPPEEPNLK